MAHAPDIPVHKAALPAFHRRTRLHSRALPDGKGDSVEAEVGIEELTERPATSS
ncbi:hypothetical protein [Rhizobium yanglingense]